MLAAASRPPLGHNPKSGLSQSSSNHLQPPGTSSSRSASPTKLLARCPQNGTRLPTPGNRPPRTRPAIPLASCFEKSAKVDGGCGVGMLMWGLTLRHGWGCEKNEKSAFNWLQKLQRMQ
ncbi:hypothetical protein BKA70DRAFT_342157 [Coprinopsis sp. MPI-PUGE-AT-0042]|nr:hypothetical protein BKA70DRAFT_342157 [Coprinopsis sp. MPI-PUGE-AT-0042]